MTIPLPLPASSTKHLDSLTHPIPRADITPLNLKQISSVASSSTANPKKGDTNPDQADTSQNTSTGTTGTTLWLGAQILSCYLRDILVVSTPRSTDGHDNRKGKRVLELGSGIGYLSLCMAHWGYEVIATDLEPVVSTVLQPNIEEGLDHLVIHNNGSIKVEELDWLHIDRNKPPEWSKNPFDMIITTDTLYAPTFVKPLWNTLRSFSTTTGGSPPPIYI